MVVVWAGFVHESCQRRAEGMVLVWWATLSGYGMVGVDGLGVGGWGVGGYGEAVGVVGVGGRVHRCGILLAGG